MSGAWKSWQGWASLVIGVLLFITPFVFGATAVTAPAWTAYIGGALLAIAGLWSLSTPDNQSIDWAQVVLGVLIFIAPWVLSFAGMTEMATSAWIAGVLAVILGGWELIGVRSHHQTLVGQR